jgi:hypothetical protein
VTPVIALHGGAVEVEFSDDEGRTCAELALPAEELLVLQHRPVAAQVA